MRNDWFLPSKLAIRLARDEVSNQEVAYLMLANFILASVMYYGAFTWANEPWTWLSFYEFVAVVAITVVGMVKCYDAAGGDANRNFAADFNCLSFPVWLWTVVVVWSVFWAVERAFRAGLVQYAYENWQISKNLAALGGSFLWLWTFLAIIAAQVLFFWWLRRILEVTARHRTRLTLSSSGHTTAGQV